MLFFDRSQCSLIAGRPGAPLFLLFLPGKERTSGYMAES